MHILDLLMYFVTSAILWYAMDFFSGGNLTEEIGGLVGMFVMIIYTIMYVVVFCFYPDWNWIDIFRGMWNIELNNWIKL